MIFPQQRKVTGTNIYPVCLRKTLSKLAETYSRKLLNSESDIYCTTKAIDAAKTLIKEVYSIKLRNKLDSGKVSLGLHSI